jgi:hypothetical protein
LALALTVGLGGKKVAAEYLKIFVENKKSIPEVMSKNPPPATCFSSLESGAG